MQEKIEGLIRSIIFMLDNNQISKTGKSINKLLRFLGYEHIANKISDLGYEIKVQKKQGFSVSGKSLRITQHAKKRLFHYLGEERSDESMKGLLTSGKIISYSDLLAHGYRPNYKDRKDNGEETVYVILPKKGLIAVLTPEGKEIVWVTTYSPNRRAPGNIPLSEEEYRKFCGMRK